MDAVVVLLHSVCAAPQLPSFVIWTRSSTGVLPLVKLKKPFQPTWSLLAVPVLIVGVMAQLSWFSSGTPL
jgi:hypothetical protein